MVSSVNTNINALAAVHALSDISNSLTMTQSRIQSGLKVSQSSDNPAVFTIAQGLRANIGALSAVSDSLQTGVATVQGASAGAVAISNALKTLVQTVTQAQGQTGDALAASQTTVNNALKNIDAYAAASTVNGVNLLNGTAASAGPPAVAAAPTAGSSLDVLSSVAGDSTTVTTVTASNSAGLGFAGGALTLGTGSAADIKTAITAVKSLLRDCRRRGDEWVGKVQDEARGRLMRLSASFSQPIPWPFPCGGQSPGVACAGYARRRRAAIRRGSGRARAC